MLPASEFVVPFGGSMLSLDSLFSFSGRIGRIGYWLVGLIQVVLLVALAAVLVATAPAGGTGSISGSTWAVLALGGLIFCWIGLAATFKRWHDRDKSALWILIGAVPVIGPIWVLIELGFLPGTAGGNRFGPPPGSGGGSWSEPADDFDAEAVVSAWKSSTATPAAAGVSPRAGDPWASRSPVIQRAAPAGGGFGRRGLK